MFRFQPVHIFYSCALTLVFTRCGLLESGGMLDLIAIVCDIELFYQPASGCQQKKKFESLVARFELIAFWNIQRKIFYLAKRSSQLSPVLTRLKFIKCSINEKNVQTTTNWSDIFYK